MLLLGSYSQILLDCVLWEFFVDSGTFLELSWMGCGCERTGISGLLVFLGFNREQSDGSASVGLLGWFLARWELCEMEIGSLAGARAQGRSPGIPVGPVGSPCGSPDLMEYWAGSAVTVAQQEFVVGFVSCFPIVVSMENT